MKLQLHLRGITIVVALSLGVVWLGSQVLLTRAAPAANPTVTVLAPSGASGDIVGEGDDYFTQVLNDPRDMNDYTDLKWQVFGVSNIAYSNGLWTGTTSNAGEYSAIYPLYPGYSAHPTGGANDLSAAEIGKTGWNYPVQANKYKQLSFRLKAPATAAGQWWHAAYTNLSFTLESGHVVGTYPADANNWQVYVTTMPWSSPIYGVEFRFGPGTGTYQFDWIRLTDPATSPLYTVRFSVGNTQTGDVVDLMCYTSVSATADQFCGRIATALPVNAPGTYQYVWHTAYLPPGQYYVRAVVRRGATTASDISNGPLTIKAAPVLHIDAPSMTSGPDYATVELGNPWDMNDSTDIFTSSDLYRRPHDFASPCPCFANGELYGTVARYDSGTLAGFSDPYVYLRVRRQVPIDTAKYKYLTYRYKIDRASWWSNSGDRLVYDSNRQVYPAGWLVRGLFFDADSLPLELQSSNTLNDLIVFDDWNIYQADLSKGIERRYWEPHSVQSNSYWTGLKYAFRFDLLEGVDPWMIHLDYVMLTGDDTANATYTVRWSQRQGSALRSIDLYASQNRAACLTSGSAIYHWASSGGTPSPAGSYRVFLPFIASTNLPPTSFVWNTSVVASGKYHVCARVSDGYNTFTTVSETPLVISH